MPLASLPNIIRVVWSGKSRPQKQNLRSQFTVRTHKVYEALQWLCQNHEDYRHVTIDEERIASWEATMVVAELLDGMGYTTDTATEDASRSGFATEDPDSTAIEGDIPHSISAIIDINNVSRSSDIDTLHQVESLRTSLDPNATINVVTGNTPLSDYKDTTYFTCALPTLFPYGTGKHLDPRRSKALSLTNWIKLLLRHSSRYILRF